MELRVLNDWKCVSCIICERYYYILKLDQVKSIVFKSVNVHFYSSTKPLLPLIDTFSVFRSDSGRCHRAGPITVQFVVGFVNGCLNLSHKLHLVTPIQLLPARSTKDILLGKMHCDRRAKSQY